MRRLVFAVFLVTSVWPPFANAQPANVCDQFAWPVTRERNLFAGNLASVDSGSSMKSDQAVTLKLKKFDEVQFTRMPERKLKNANSFAGLLILSSIEPGLYQMTLSSEAWIDVIQNDAYLKTVAHSSKRECAEIRKSVQFDIAKGPVIVQISGVDVDAIKLAILPAAK